MNDILHPDKSDQQREGSVRYDDATLSNGHSISFASQGLYLTKARGEKFAVFITEGGAYDEPVVIEVLAKERATSRRFLSELRALADRHSIYRGKVISMQTNIHNVPCIKFHDIPKIDRSQLILPKELISQIEKHTSFFSEHRDLLVARGLHLKRGLLLYGPPGIGKTLTMMHVISNMPERTSILLKAASIDQLNDACALSRSLQPATIVIDDVDLIAEDRVRHSNNTVLFELLNHMEDCDILFLLGTNRPEALEPALAARPGRVDQALLIPLPDDDCRRRLFEFYSKDVPLAFTDNSKFVESTKGASAAFIRELIRKASRDACFVEIICLLYLPLKVQQLLCFVRT
jgi:SpoVK/Ycf46/Vps4 family AAA+-type ATPase